MRMAGSYVFEKFGTYNGFCAPTSQCLWYRVLLRDTHYKQDVSVHTDIWAVFQRYAAGGIFRSTLLRSSAEDRVEQ